jgi:predicted AAA+ superfamily ATPase
MNYLFELSDRLVKFTPQDFRRYLFATIPLDQRLVIIKGARGTGKTTLLLQLMQSLPAAHHEKLFISLDNIYFLENRLFQVADQFVKQGGRYLLLDEIHRYEGWIKEIKHLYDHFPGLKIIGTGSSALNIHRGEADLSRRALIFNLNELSLREFLELSQHIRIAPVSLEDVFSRHPEICAEIGSRTLPVRLFQEYLRFGTFPYFLEGGDYYHERVRSTINTILESDLPAIENISYHSIVQIKKLLFILSESVPFTPNISELGRKMGLSRDVLLKHLFLLEKAELIYQLRRETAGISYLAKPEKLYLHNPNLAFTLSPRRPDKGNLRETFILNQLSVRHEVTWSGTGDFLTDNRFTIEVGGKNKKAGQIKNVGNSYIAADDIETGIGNKIPIWLFGFLY